MWPTERTIISATSPVSPGALATTALTRYIAKNAENIAIAFQNGKLFAAYKNGTEQVTVKPMTAITGRICRQWIRSPRRRICLLAFVGTVPIVAYTDNQRVRVRQYDGKSWRSLGNPGKAAPDVRAISLAVEGKTPFIAFKDAHQNIRVLIGKGSDWKPLGVIDNCPAKAPHVSLALVDKIIYIAYKGMENQVCVRRFNGWSWDPIEVKGFAANTARTVAITAAADTVFIAFKNTKQQVEIVKLNN